MLGYLFRLGACASSRMSWHMATTNTQKLSTRLGGKSLSTCCAPFLGFVQPHLISCHGIGQASLSMLCGLRACPANVPAARSARLSRRIHIKQGLFSMPVASLSNCNTSLLAWNDSSLGKRARFPSSCILI